MIFLSVLPESFALELSIHSLWSKDIVTNSRNCYDDKHWTDVWFSKIKWNKTQTCINNSYCTGIFQFHEVAVDLVALIIGNKNTNHGSQCCGHTCDQTGILYVFLI